MAEVANFLNGDGWACEDCSSRAIVFHNWNGVVVAGDTRQPMSNYTGLSYHAYKVGFLPKAYC